MILRRRRTALPDPVREVLDLPADDAVLTAAAVEDGWVVATRRGLSVVRGGSRVLVRAWTDVDGARLDDDAGTLTVTWVDGTAPTVLDLSRESRSGLHRTVHDRVQSSVVHTEKVTVRGGQVRVALRRDADGGLFTQVIGPGRVDLADPVTAEAVDAAEARVREAAGLE